MESLNRRYYAGKCCLGEVHVLRLQPLGLLKTWFLVLGGRERSWEVVFTKKYVIWFVEWTKLGRSINANQRDWPWPGRYCSGFNWGDPHASCNSITPSLCTSKMPEKEVRHCLPLPKLQAQKWFCVERSWRFGGPWMVGKDVMEKSTMHSPNTSTNWLEMVV